MWDVGCGGEFQSDRSWTKGGSVCGGELGGDMELHSVAPGR
jgi:hypothetical protein